MRIKLGLILMSIFLISIGYAAAEDSVTFSGRIATQYELRWHDTESDQDIAQYLALDVENLWKDKLDAAIYLQLWEDIDGRYRPQGLKYYYLYQGISDTFTRSVNDRIYYGYFDLKNVVGASQFRLGRQYLFELEGIQFDGLRWKLENLNGFDILAFVGQPVTYYAEMDSHLTYGGTLAYKFNRELKLGLDYLKYSEDSIGDNYFAFQMQNQLFDRFRIDSKYAMLDSDPRDFQIQANYTNPVSDWNINATYYQQIIKLQQYSNQFSPYYAALSDYAPFRQINLAVYKDFNPIFAGEAGITKRQMEHSGDASEFNREYDLFYATLILRNIGVKGLSFSVTGQRWYTDSYTRTTTYYDDSNATEPVTAVITMPSDSETTLGAELKYQVAKKLTLNLGTDYSRYKYDFDTNAEQAKVRTIYTKCRWKINKRLEWYTKLYREKQSDDEHGFYKVRSTLTYSF
jgi:hypothetical protein